MNIYGSFIHNSPELQAKRPSTGKWIKKSWNILLSGILSAIKRNRLPIQQQHYRKRSTLDSKGYV
jgi:hypothetical protein